MYSCVHKLPILCMFKGHYILKPFWSVKTYGQRSLWEEKTQNLSVWKVVSKISIPFFFFFFNLWDTGRKLISKCLSLVQMIFSSYEPFLNAQKWMQLLVGNGLASISICNPSIDASRGRNRWISGAQGPTSWWAPYWWGYRPHEARSVYKYLGL